MVDIIVWEFVSCIEYNLLLHKPLDSGKASQDVSSPPASSRGRISWNSAAHTVVVILSHSCLVVL